MKGCVIFFLDFRYNFPNIFNIISKSFATYECCHSCLHYEMTEVMYYNFFQTYSLNFHRTKLSMIFLGIDNFLCKVKKTISAWDTFQKLDRQINIKALIWKKNQRLKVFMSNFFFFKVFESIFLFILSRKINPKYEL